jgi:hypothetical protein
MNSISVLWIPGKRSTATTESIEQKARYSTGKI